MEVYGAVAGEKLYSLAYPDAGVQVYWSRPPDDFEVVGFMVANPLDFIGMVDAISERGPAARYREALRLKKELAK